MSLTQTLVRARDSIREQEARLDKVQGFAATHEEQRAVADLQDRHRQLFADLEMSVPEPRNDESFHRYYTRLLSRLQPCSRQFRDVDLHRLPPHAGFRPIAEQIVTDAERLAGNARVGSTRNPGQLRRIERTDEAGQTVTNWHGSPLSWMQQFMTPVETCVVGLGDGRRFYHMP